MLALWNLDLAFADVVATSSIAELGAVRLAWWRERLEELDRGTPAAEPRLRAVAETLIPRGVSGSELSELENCWLALFRPFPWGTAVAEAMRRRGEILFGIAARLLGREAQEGVPYGAVWSLVDAARHCTDASSRAMLIDAAKTAIAALPRRSPGELRPLTMIAAFAAHDAFHNGRGGWGRFRAGLAHSMFGITPRR